MLRKQLKQDSHFLVKYVCDDNLQIRTRSFFKTDSKIDIMGLYEVQWGRSDDVDSALVIASGDYDSIRALYQEYQCVFTPECSYTEFFDLMLIFKISSGILTPIFFAMLDIQKGEHYCFVAPYLHFWCHFKYSCLYVVLHCKHLFV